MCQAAAGSLADLVGLVPEELLQDQSDQLEDSDDDANDLSRRSVITHWIYKVLADLV